MAGSWTSEESAGCASPENSVACYEDDVAGGSVCEVYSAGYVDYCYVPTCEPDYYAEYPADYPRAERGGGSAE